MAYLRKPIGQKRGKESKDGATLEKPPKAPIQPQMPSPPVAFAAPCAEDKASHERHIKMLQRECRNIHPNKQVTYTCMHACMHAPCSMSYYVIHFQSACMQCCIICVLLTGNKGSYEADIQIQTSGDTRASYCHSESIQKLSPTHGS